MKCVDDVKSPFTKWNVEEGGILESGVPSDIFGEISVILRNRVNQNNLIRQIKPRLDKIRVRI